MSSIDIGKLSMSFQESFIGSRDQCHVWILLIPDPRDLQKLIGEYETRFCYDDPLVTYDESIDPETFDENRRPGILVGRMSHHSGPEEKFRNHIHWVVFVHKGATPSRGTFELNKMRDWLVHIIMPQAHGQPKRRQYHCRLILKQNKWAWLPRPGPIANKVASEAWSRISEDVKKDRNCDMQWWSTHLPANTILKLTQMLADLMFFGFEKHRHKEEFVEALHKVACRCVTQCKLVVRRDVLMSVDPVTSKQFHLPKNFVEFLNRSTPVFMEDPKREATMVLHFAQQCAHDCMRKALSQARIQWIVADYIPSKKEAFIMKSSQKSTGAHGFAHNLLPAQGVQHAMALFGRQKALRKLQEAANDDAILKALGAFDLVMLTQSGITSAPRLKIKTPDEKVDGDMTAAIDDETADSDSEHESEPDHEPEGNDQISGSAGSNETTTKIASTLAIFFLLPPVFEEYFCYNAIRTADRDSYNPAASQISRRQGDKLCDFKDQVLRTICEILANQDESLTAVQRGLLEEFIRNMDEKHPLLLRFTACPGQVISINIIH